MRVSAVVALIVASTILARVHAGDPPESKPAAADKEKLQGKWVLESIDGTAVTKGRTIRFTDDKVSNLFLTEKGDERVAAFKLLADQKVKGIDVGPQISPTKEHGFLQRGIYYLDGDILKLVFLPKLDARQTPPGVDREGRPSTFDPKLVTVMVFRREKP
jgi:uncharacterized protein (TIGR03067 family)